MQGLNPIKSVSLRAQASAIFLHLSRFSEEESDAILMSITNLCSKFFENLPMLIETILDPKVRPLFMASKFWAKKKDARVFERDSFVKLI